MKQLIRYSAGIGTLLLLLLLSVSARAQNKVEIDTNEIGTWFERNWMWVAGALVLIILIGALARRRHPNNTAGGTRRTTTVVKDASGNTKSVSTTEENI